MGQDADGYWGIARTVCSECHRSILFLGPHPEVKGFGTLVDVGMLRFDVMVRPKAIARAPLPDTVPPPLAKEYTEACAVLADSPRASAALSRRCLQSLLRDHAKTKAKDLAAQINEVLDSKELPSDLAQAVDSVRATGNFGAHPIKSTNTGEIIDVVPGEAEWQLETLEALFDYYFVRPAALKARRDAINAKLKEAGKPELK